MDVHAWTQTMSYTNRILNFRLKRAWGAQGCHVSISHKLPPPDIDFGCKKSAVSDRHKGKSKGKSILFSEVFIAANPNVQMGHIGGHFQVANDGQFHDWDLSAYSSDAVHDHGSHWTHRMHPICLLFINFHCCRCTVLETNAP